MGTASIHEGVRRMRFSLGAQGTEAFGAPQEASTPAASGHAAASGWVAPCQDRRSACDGPDCHDGRCDERDLLDMPGRGRRDGVDVPGLGRSDWRAWSGLRALHRSRRPLPLHPPKAGEKVSKTQQLQVEQRNRPGGLTSRQSPCHDQPGGAVHAFRLLRNSTTKATDHELQKYDNFTRYGQTRLCCGSRPTRHVVAQLGR
jgi:hypothetical protein